MLEHVRLRIQRLLQRRRPRLRVPGVCLRHRLRGLRPAPTAATTAPSATACATLCARPVLEHVRLRIRHRVRRRRARLRVPGVCLRHRLRGLRPAPTAATTAPSATACAALCAWPVLEHVQLRIRHRVRRRRPRLRVPAILRLRLRLRGLWPSPSTPTAASTAVLASTAPSGTATAALAPAAALAKVAARFSWPNCASATPSPAAAAAPSRQVYVAISRRDLGRRRGIRQQPAGWPEQWNLSPTPGAAALLRAALLYAQPQRGRRLSTSLLYHRPQLVLWYGRHLSGE